MIDYSSLFALAAVVREGSFERAARSLHVTPSAVSQRIRLLEERMGCALVTRSQPCAATETGQRLCQHADRVRLLELELHEDSLAFMPGEMAQVNVPVAVNADSLATWFVPAMIAFTSTDSVLMQLSVDDEGHTAQWLRGGKVLAAVTADEKPAAGCNSRPLGAMRYVATATPEFVRRHFPDGVDAASLAFAPSLRFNAKDELQQRWVERHCGGKVELRSHTMPSPHAFVSATLGGLGWALHPQALVRTQLASGAMVELMPECPLDVPLYWQQARIASRVMDSLSHAVVSAAQAVLIQDLPECFDRGCNDCSQPEPAVGGQRE